MKLKLALVGSLAVIVVALPAPAVAATAPTPQQVSKLKRDLRDAKASRDRFKRRAATAAKDVAVAKAVTAAAVRDRDEARRAVFGTVAEQVRQVALAGSAQRLFDLVFTPIRANWPCGSSIFQGNSTFSIDVNLSDTDFSKDPPTERNCR